MVPVWNTVRPFMRGGDSAGEHVAVESVQPGDHLGQVHDRVNSDRRGADPCAATPWVITSIQPNPWCSTTSSSVGCGSMTIAASMPARARPGAPTRSRPPPRRPRRPRAGRRAAASPTDASDAQHEHAGRTAGLVVGHAEPVQQVPVEPRDQRLIRPVREADRVGVRVHAERGTAAGAAQPGQHVRPSGLDLDDLDLGAGAGEPLGDELGHAGLARAGGNQPRRHGLDPDHGAEQIDGLGCG